MKIWLPRPELPTIVSRRLLSNVSYPSAELAASAPQPAVSGWARGAPMFAQWLTPVRLYLVIAGVALVIAALSLLIPSTPSYDPWAWLVWGREIIHLDLHTTGGPTWKPLPVIFTTVFALFGKAQPDLWLVVARTGALMAVAMTFRFTFRLTRLITARVADTPRVADPARAADTPRVTGTAGVAVPPAPATGASRVTSLALPLLAAVIAALGLISAGGFITDNALGYSEGLMTALVLIAIERHLDGERRQAFAIGFGAALDRPEIWAFWGLYGLYLFRTDPAARKLVIGLFALIPVLWFGPELWGSGHLFRGVTRAHTPRSNSPAFAPCPFCAVLRHHAWPLVLLRIKVAGAVFMLVAAFGGFRLWRSRDRKGAPGIDAQNKRASGIAFMLGALGIAWFVLIAIMTQIGFSGNDRYLVLGSALVCIVGGVGWAWAGRVLVDLLRRVSRAGVATLASVGALIVVFMLVPSWIGSNVVDIPATHRALNYQAKLREDLPSAVREAGGAAALLRCGTIMTEGFQVPMVAWTLDVRTLRIEANPANAPAPGAPLPPAPNVIIQTRAQSNASLLPRIPRNATYTMLAHVRTFRVYSTCRR